MTLIAFIITSEKYLKLWSAKFFAPYDFLEMNFYYNLLYVYTSEMFEHRLLAYEDDSILLAVVPMPADRPAVAASLDKDLARIEE